MLYLICWQMCSFNRTLIKEDCGYLTRDRMEQDVACLTWSDFIVGDQARTLLPSTLPASGQWWNGNCPKNLIVSIIKKNYFRSTSLVQKHVNILICHHAKTKIYSIFIITVFALSTLTLTIMCMPCHTYTLLRSYADAQTRRR